MITNKQIKEIVAPKLKKLREKGYQIRYLDDNYVSLSNEEYGIKIKGDTDLYGPHEYWLTTDNLKGWYQSPRTIEELLNRFKIVLDVDDLLKLIDKE